MSSNHALAKVDACADKVQDICTLVKNKLKEKSQEKEDSTFQLDELDKLVDSHIQSLEQEVSSIVDHTVTK
jgi:hypothetical protein